MKAITAQLLLLRDLTKREFKMRYLGSMLGSSWNLIHPLVMILVYTLVFSQVMHSRLGANSGPFAYSLYLCSGLLAWSFFQETVTRGVNTILDNAAFMKKMAFPPVVLFGATVASAAINFAIAFGLFTIALVILKPVSIVFYLTFLFVVALLAVFGFGIALGLGCLNVFLRDVQQLVAVTFQLWFWFTPIIYLVDALPEMAHKLIIFNPAYAFIGPMHDLLYFERFPEPYFWALMLGWIALSLAFGGFVYRRSIRYVRDQL
jgi:lipopolysaccharide transport system permease protein